MQFKKLIFPVIVLGALAIGIGGWIGVTHAAANTNNPQTIVDKLAAKFNLKKADVQAVFDAQRQERQKDCQAKMDDRLNSAVKNGVITEDQKQKLIQKRKELSAKRQQENQDMQKWMKDNGIDQNKLAPYMGMRFGHRGHQGMMGNKLKPQ